MVFFFSGTGNSEYVAKQMAEISGEKMISIAECLKKGSFSFRLHPKERIGFVTPVYFWGLPQIVIEFLKELTFLDDTTSHYAYHIITFGTTTGQAHYMMESLLKGKGISLVGKFSVKMVDVWTPLFDLTDKSKCLHTTNKAKTVIEKIAIQINNRNKGSFDWRSFPHLLAQFYYMTYEWQRQTRHFHVLKERCSGCGLCSKNCPIDSIKMENGMPKWTKEKCVMCLRCLHYCPTFAIQYGKNSIKHGQWHFNAT